MTHRGIDSSWQRRRSEFNHQWLKNRVLSALDATANVLRGAIEGDEAMLLCDVVFVDLREWPRRHIEVARLLEDLEESMSPKVLFSHPPFDAWEVDLRFPCEELVHEIWLHRYSISRLRDRAVEAVDRADDTYRALAAVVRAPGRAFDPEASRRLFCELTTQFRVVAASIDALPSRILLP